MSDRHIVVSIDGYNALVKERDRLADELSSVIKDGREAIDLLNELLESSRARCEKAEAELQKIADGLNIPWPHTSLSDGAVDAGKALQGIGKIIGADNWSNYIDLIREVFRLKKAMFVSQKSQLRAEAGNSRLADELAEASRKLDVWQRYDDEEVKPERAAATKAIHDLTVELAEWRKIAERRGDELKAIYIQQSKEVTK